ncbi:MAG TPA: hypothetical protein VFG35_25090 [Actinoplanes sp.]|nr:hypothetical protein [Actinoplanes sp.]
MTKHSPDDQLFLSDVATMLEVSYDTAKAYHLRGTGGFPAAEPQRVPGAKGRTRPWWRRSVIEAWIKSRPGPGHYDRSGVRGSYKPETKPRRGAEERVTCGTCSKSIGLTLDGLVRVHGPRNKRCAGSWARMVVSTREAA